MTRSEIIQAVDDAIEKLRQPLPPEEHAFGWTDAKRLDILRYFENLVRDLREDKTIPFFSLIRALDGMGISEGELFEEVCRINNAVNRLSK